MIRTSKPKTNKNPIKTTTKAHSPSEQRQLLFAQEYIIDLNITKAAIRAGIPEKSAHSQGYDYLKKPLVVSYIQRHMDERAKRTAITADRVLEEVARIALFNPQKLYNEFGDFLPITEMDEDTARAIASIEIKENWSGRGLDALMYYTKKIKTIDKKGALELLMKHLQILNDKVDHTSSDGSMTPQKTVVILPAKNEVPK